MTLLACDCCNMLELHENFDLVMVLVVVLVMVLVMKDLNSANMPIEEMKMMKP